MKSRMEKYYGNNDTTKLRTTKNEDIYKKIHDNEIKDFNVNSNISILGDNSKNIDIENLKQILDKKYRDNHKRRSIDVGNINLNDYEEIKDEEKDYDINTILEKAYERKNVDYSENRLKKLRDTQYDILKNLNLEEKSEEPSTEEKNLMTLINTIAENEKGANPLDLLSDLKGNDDEEVVAGAASTKTLELKSTDEVKKLNNDKIVLKENNLKTDESSIDNSFYTNSLKINKKDFEDFSDLQNDTKGNKFRILFLIIIMLIIIVGGLILLNRFLHLGIF